MWSDNPIEYIRLQVDHSNSFNVKRVNNDLIRNLCNIKKSRKQQISENLTQYLTLILTNLASGNEDWRQKEALLHAFGLLSGHMAVSIDYMKNAELLLQQHVYSELIGDNPYMRARACWVYGQFGNFTFENEDHLRYVLDSLYKNLEHIDLPVRVNAAIALINMLSHDIAV